MDSEAFDTPPQRGGERPKFDPLPYIRLIAIIVSGLGATYASFTGLDSRLEAITIKLAGYEELRIRRNEELAELRNVDQAVKDMLRDQATTLRDHARRLDELDAQRRLGLRPRSG